MAVEVNLSNSIGKTKINTAYQLMADVISFLFTMSYGI